MNLGNLIEKKGADIYTVKTNDTIETALATLNEKQIGALIVLDAQGEIAGIVGERDFLMICHKCGEKKYVHEIMTPKDKLVTLNSKDSIQTAMKTFTEKKMRHLPVVEHGKLVGLVSIGDSVKELLDAMEEENKYLTEYIMGQNI